MGKSFSETTLTFRKLIADEGYVLTDGDGSYGKIFYVPNTASTDSYETITDAEYAEIMNQAGQEAAE